MSIGKISPLRVLVALCGDMTRDPESIVKYGTFIEALGRRFSVPAVYNAKLHGLHRIKNAISVWHPDLKTWKARASKNPEGFIARSKRAAHWTSSMQDQADLILQLGVLFDSDWDNNPLPHIIYTDYTSSMSARRPAAGRSPFHGRLLSRWLELEHRAFDRAKHICVRSDAVRNSLVQDYSLAPGKITVVGGGVNLQQLPDLAECPAGRAPTVLFIGTDFYRKGGDLVLNSFAMVRTVIPDAQLVFISQDPVPPSFPRAGVKIMAPIWDREQFLELFCQADVLVLPSRLETWGDVLLEAMAFGLPCIGVTGQSMDEIIRDGETGLLVPPERIDALTDALVSLLKQPELCRKMGEAGRTLITREFTWDLVVDRIAPTVESTVRRSGAP